MISVIISVYNVAPYLERCVNSILRQSYSNLEVILVDDGSTDGSGKLCDSLAEIDERIIVVHKKNGGNASARNAGIDIAKGEYIAFVDADDYIEHNMYEEMLKAMYNKNITIACCGIIVTSVDGKDSIHVSEERKIYSREEALLDIFLRTGNVSATACNKLYRNSLFSSGLRYNNEVIHEDTEAMPRFLDAVDSVIVIDKAFYHYIKRNNSASTSRKFSLKGYHILDSMKDYERMCKKKYPNKLPYFHYYELVTTFEMLLNLAGCNDRHRYLVQELSLRKRILQSVLKCMRWKDVKRRNVDQIKVMLVKAVLGVNLASFIFHID